MRWHWRAGHGAGRAPFRLFRGGACREQLLPTQPRRASLGNFRGSLSIYGVIENNGLVFMSVLNLHGGVIGTERIFYLKRRDRATELVNITEYARDGALPFLCAMGVERS